MPYRHFNGTTDTIKFDRGACDVTGAVTMLVHCLPDPGQAGQLAGIYESLNAAGELKNYGVYARETSPKFEVDNGEPGSSKVGTGPGGYFGEGEWSYLVFTKAAGTVKGNWWGRYENKNEWVHATTSETLVDGALMGAGGYMDIGGGGDGFFWAGGIASIGRWDKALTQAEVEVLGGVAHLEDLLEFDPVGLWLLNQTDPSVPVPDRTGNGADQIAISGTSVVDEEPRVIGFASKESPISGAHMEGGFVRDSARRLVVVPEGKGRLRNGFLRTASGAIAVAVNGTGTGRPDFGLIRDAERRLCVVEGGAIHHRIQGLPCDAEGRIVVVTTGGVSFSQGLLRDAQGRVVVVGL